MPYPLGHGRLQRLIIPQTEKKGKWELRLAENLICGRAFWLDCREKCGAMICDPMVLELRRAFWTMARCGSGVPGGC